MEQPTEEEILELQEGLLMERQGRLFAEFELAKRDLIIIKTKIKELKEVKEVKKDGDDKDI